MNDEDGFEVRRVALPIPFGGSIHLTLAGHVTIVTSEGDCDLDDQQIADVADLLAEARLIQGGTR